MKVLKSQTIVPQHLYVERAADRQIRQIIDDMGRPGYVLVARQMGKTNLLLNARRNLSSSTLAFVYLDLSNKLDSATEFYADLTQKLFDAVAPLNEQVAKGALDRRDDNVDYRFFEQTLKSVLTAYTGKVVIILDEVDALQKYSFGARILSHIRSIYFAGRANNDEFWRVTFILSGVAEPGDLIKDKSVSPFNIGEKIYLTDFGYEEFLNFSELSTLRFSDDVLTSIFQWANGNPRITWDICSALEDLLNRDGTVDTKAVNDVVNKLYLDNFDTAPVDHIRSVVADDREIRDALLQMHNGFSAEIPDKIKSRMYLAGIISSPDAKSMVKIKNPIISEALSRRWIDDISRMSRGLINLAREHFEEGRYDIAVSLFEEYMQNNEIDPNSPDAVRLANAYYLTGKYIKAGEWYQNALRNSSISVAVESASRYRLGIVNYFNANLEAALQSFDKVLALGAGNSLYGACLTRQAAIYAELDIAKNKYEVVRLSEQALNWLDITRVNAETPLSTRGRAFGNLAKAAEFDGNVEKSVQLYRDAISASSGIEKINLIVRLLELDHQFNEAADYASELAAVVDDELAEAESYNRPSEVLAKALVSSLILLRTKNFLSQFETTVANAERRQSIVGMSRPALLLHLWDQSSDSYEESHVGFLEDVIAQFGRDSRYNHEARDAARNLIVVTRNEKWFDIYFKLYELTAGEGEFDVMDYYAFSFVLTDTLQKGNTDRISKVLEASRFLAHPNRANLRVNYALIMFYELQYVSRTQVSSEILSFAIEFKSHLTKHSEDYTPLIQKEFMHKLIENADYHIARHQPKERLINPFKHYGRNTRMFVKYKDGREVVDKFKKLQRDLVLENCKLVEVIE